MVWLPRGGGGGLLFISFSSFLWDDMLRLGQTRPDQTRKDKTCVDICRCSSRREGGRKEAGGTASLVLARGRGKVPYQG